MSGKKSFEELELTRSEVERIGEALKKPEFRELLHDYVREIQDPENRKLYESEIIQLEKERGVDATFINPEPGYVIKTTLDGERKCFINISTNINVLKPSSKAAIRGQSKGVDWSLPHTVTPPREDLDKKGTRCTVYDVVFHPDTLQLSVKNKSFRDMVETVALDAIESNFDVKLDRNNLKLPKMQYKGVPRPSLLRKPSQQPALERTEPFEKELFNRIYAQADLIQDKVPRKSTRKSRSTSEYTTPKYAIKHRSHVDIQEFVDSREAKLHTAIPKELIVEINLPLLKSANEVTLDVTEKTLSLVSNKPAKYKLDLTLPYRVISDNGSAKFDKDSKKLCVCLPVNRAIFVEYNNRDDSGVESDQNSPPSPKSKIHSPDEINPKVSSDVRTTFLDENITYNLPEFTCNVFDNVLAFILNVKNVDNGSVQEIIEPSAIHVKFFSISSSFYTEHYSFYISLPKHVEINTDQVQIETWDNNVTLHVPLNNRTKISNYFYGLNSENLESKSIEEPVQVLQHQLEELKVEENPVKSSSLEDKSGFSISSGYSYESSGDELSCSFSPSKGKGILKNLSSNRRFTGRSVSESSLDDYVVVAKSLDSASILQNSPLPEDGEMSNSLKKTVRFNDVIKKQLYRSNSSILGQKKKNQRKARNKKRAQERRHSESEASEVDDHHKEEDDEEEEEELNRKEAITGKHENDIFEMDMNC